MLTFIICFMLVVWFFGAFLPWVIEHWAQALGFVIVATIIMKSGLT